MLGFIAHKGHILSCIFIFHFCDFEISNASMYYILKCLQVFHFAWQPACTSMVLCSCEVTSGEPPASQEECGLKENMSCVLVFVFFFVPVFLMWQILAHVKLHRGNRPPLKRSTVLKRISLGIWFYLYLFCVFLIVFVSSLWDEIIAHVRWHVVPWCC